MDRAAGWTGRQFSLGHKKGVYDTELYALRRALPIFGERGERDRQYTIFAGSASDIDHIASDRLGPGKRLAVEAIGACSRLRERRNSVTIRWTPAHLGWMADFYAKRAAESELHAVDRPYLRETPFAHMTRGEDQQHEQLDGSQFRRRRGYRQELRHERKALAGRCYQLLSGNAATGAFLCHRLKKIPSDRCWRCGRDERQTRHRVFVGCEAWAVQRWRTWKGGEGSRVETPEGPSDGNTLWG